jgi:hypothetical protein
MKKINQCNGKLTLNLFHFLNPIKTVILIN